MTDYIYNYPKSFCDYTFPNPSISSLDVNNGTPSNLSVTYCSIPNQFNNINKIYFKSDIQPVNNNSQSINNINPDKNNYRYSYYNADAITSKYSNDFQLVENTNTNNKNACPSVSYYSPDPRLIDVPRSIRTTLDIPPIESTVHLSNIYKIDKNYGKGYTTYDNVKAGQILYYNDKDIQDPYYQPNFVDRSIIQSYLYQDPMGAIKPQYDRIQINDICSKSKNCNFNGCLSSIADSQSFRQDLMSKQMRKMNQEKWTARWS